MKHKTYSHDALDASELTLNAILELIVEGTWDWNAETGQVVRSPGWYRMLGYPVGVFLPDVFTWEKIIHPDDYGRVMEHFEQYINGTSDRYCIEYRCRKSDDTYIWIEDRGQAITKNEDGVVTRMIGAHHNINKRKIAELELEKQTKILQEGNQSLEKLLAHKAVELENKNRLLEEQIITVEKISQTDPLTSVANRKKFEQELLKEISRSDRYKHPLSLIIFDIDLFKRINDSYGHSTGDAVLKAVAEKVNLSIRTIDFFARWGGDEFVIILPDLHMEKAVRVANKLRYGFSELQLEPDLKITCSFGVVEYQADESMESLFKRADRSLYLAKSNGRDRVENLKAG